MEPQSSDELAQEAEIKRIEDAEQGLEEARQISLSVKRLADDLDNIY